MQSRDHELFKECMFSNITDNSTIWQGCSIQGKIQRSSSTASLDKYKRYSYHLLYCSEHINQKYVDESKSSNNNWIFTFKKYFSKHWFKKRTKSKDNKHLAQLIN